MKSRYSVKCSYFSDYNQSVLLISICKSLPEDSFFHRHHTTSDNAIKAVKTLKHQGSKIVPLDFLPGQVTFLSHLPNEQGTGQVISQSKHYLRDTCLKVKLVQSEVYFLRTLKNATSCTFNPTRF